MATLSALFGGAYYGTRGGSKKTTTTPPINASSPEEADFIKYEHHPRPRPLDFWPLDANVMLQEIPG